MFYILVTLLVIGVISAGNPLMDLAEAAASRSPRLFGSSKYRLSLFNYNPFAYYGYGYRPYAGRFGGYLGFLG